MSKLLDKLKQQEKHKLLQMPKLPEMLKLPDKLKQQEKHKLLQMPKLPEMLKLPDKLKQQEKHKLLEMPKLPEMLKLPDKLKQQEKRKLLQMPKLPEMLKLPDKLKQQEKHKLLEMPDVCLLLQSIQIWFDRELTKIYLYLIQFSLTDKHSLFLLQEIVFNSCNLFLSHFFSNPNNVGTNFQASAPYSDRNVTQDYTFGQESSYLTA